MRLTACLGVALDIILPCAFPLDDKSMKRAALDYGPLAHVTRHANWSEFLNSSLIVDRRLVLFTTKGEPLFPNFEFRADDVLIMGSESHGAPDFVHRAAAARVRIPLVVGARSLNLAVTSALALGEALRQTDGFPPQ